MKEFFQYDHNFVSCLNIIAHLSSLKDSPALIVMLDKNKLIYDITGYLKFIGKETFDKS